MSGDTCIAEPRPGRVPRELACRPRSQQPAAQQSHRTSEHRPPPPPPPLTGARDRSQQGAACRARAPIGRGATSPPSPIQEAAGSSEASVALVGTPIPIPIPTTPHHSARCARGERRPADPRPHAARSGTAVQPPPRLKTGIGARGCVAYTSSNRNNTIPHGYELLNIWPPEFRVQARPRACGTVLPSPVPQLRFRDCAWVYEAVAKDAKAIREVR